jgi:hypothetical protein
VVCRTNVFLITFIISVGCFLFYMTGYIFQNFFHAIFIDLHKHNWSMWYMWTCHVFLCRVKDMSPSECDIQYNILGIYNAVCLKVPCFRVIFQKCFKLPEIKILIQNYVKALLSRYAHLLKDTIKHGTGMHKTAASVFICTVVWHQTHARRCSMLK